MPATRSTETAATTRARRRRAHAERSIAVILDAAVEALASDPQASMAEIARRAGVVRATLYVHFPTPEALLEGVTQRSIAEALQRVLIAAWRHLARYQALVAINTQLPPAELRRRHRPVLALLQPLIERGQRTGAFRADLPAPSHLSMLLATVLGALDATPPPAANNDESSQARPRPSRQPTTR